MSTLTQFLKRLAHSRSRRRLAVSKSSKLKLNYPSTDLVSNSENIERSQNVPALQEPQHKVTHLYKGRKVMKFDSKRSRSHIEKLILIRSCSSTRRREGKILLEGKKLITDAIVQGKVEPIAFYSWRAENFLEVPAAGVTSSVNFFVLEKRDYLRLTLLETPQPVVALCRLPSEIVQMEDSFPLHVICDGVRDPGNLGTLIRSAAAVGCQSILTLKGTCDPWDPKVVRSSAGSNFLLPIISYISWKDVGTILPEDTKYLFASSDVSDLSYDQIEWSEDSVDNSLDSWNVFDDSQFQDEQSGFDAEPSTEASENQSNKTEVKSEPSSMALVISNEGWGLSEGAVMAMEKLGGSSVHVPMSGSVNSLNCSIAASVIMWEVRRKYRMKLSKLNEPF